MAFFDSLDYINEVSNLSCNDYQCLSLEISHNDFMTVYLTIVYGHGYPMIMWHF